MKQRALRDGPWQRFRMPAVFSAPTTNDAAKQ
jgi:hypothetical protein